MATNRTRRIAKELNDIRQDAQTQIFAEAVNEALHHLRASFPGPPETPYEGGTYVVDIQIPNEYPFRPPIMKFETKIWHPNISSVTGAICLDTLGTAWSPVLTIKSALLSLQSLLNSPEPKDPQDAEVAGMLMRNPKQFEQVAREWAVKYAGAPASRLAQASSYVETVPPVIDYQGYNKHLVDRFTSMGFDVDSVVAAFNYVGIDRNGGRDYELEEAYMGDITARLLGEP